VVVFCLFACWWYHLKHNWDWRMKNVYSLDWWFSKYIFY
jgi:hypothetical protein